MKSHVRIASNKLRIAHLTYNERYSTGMGGLRCKLTLIDHMDPNLFEHHEFVQESVPTNMKRELERAHPMRVHDGLATASAMAAALRSYDIALVHGGSHLHFAAAHAAGIPLIVERVVCPGPAQASPHVDWSICISRDVLRLQPDPDRATLIYSGVDLSRFHFDRRAFRRPDRLVLAQVGAPYDIDVASMNKVIACLLAQDIPAEGWIIGQDGPSTPHLRFWGWREDVHLLLRDVDILLHFNPRHEAFGLQVPEAMASGVIPIVEGSQGPAEIVEDGAGGFHFKRGDLDRVVHLASTLWKQHSLGPTEPLTAAIRRAQERARAFDARQMAAAYGDLLLDLWREKRTSPRPQRLLPSEEDPFHAALDRLYRADLAGFIHAMTSLADTPLPPSFIHNMAPCVFTLLAVLGRSNPFLAAFLNHWVFRLFELSAAGRRRDFLMTLAAGALPLDSAHEALNALRRLARAAPDPNAALPLLARAALAAAAADEALRLGHAGAADLERDALHLLGTLETEGPDRAWSAWQALGGDQIVSPSWAPFLQSSAA